MNVYLSEKTIAAIQYFQENPNHLDWISNAEEYLIDNCAERNECQNVINIVQGLITVRKTLKDIVLE
jgi:hypothetical protein